MVFEFNSLKTCIFFFIIDFVLYTLVFNVCTTQ